MLKLSFLGIIYIMDNIKLTFMRLFCCVIACAMALSAVGCGRAESVDEPQDVIPIFDIDAEAASVQEPLPSEDDKDRPSREDEDNSVVEIIVTPSLEPVVTPVPTPRLPEVVSCDPAKGYTKKSGVNLREQPTTDSEVLDTLDKAVSLTIKGTAGEWTYVSVNDHTGFISSEFVGKGSVPSVLTIDSVKRQNGIATASVNMRKSPDTKADIIDELKIFTPFTITGENKDWYEIEYQGKRGYVSKKYSEPSSGYYKQEELYLVAQLVHQEAKYTSKEGLIAVANVVYNRLRSSKFPNSLEGVIFQDGQFSPAESGRNLRSVKPSSGAVDATLEVFARGKTILPRNVLYFRASRMGKEWASSRTYYGQYGGNYFYK